MSGASIGDADRAASEALTESANHRTGPNSSPIIEFVDPELTSKLKAVLDEHPDVIVAYVFGSAARGELRPSSDIDVAVLMAETEAPPIAKLTLKSMQPALQADLQQAVRRPVDLVVLNHASPDLVHRVLRDSVLLIERDRSARVRFEVRLRNDYFDVLPFLIRYREAALR